MTSRNQYAAVLLLMGLLIASACSAIPGADADASVIGVSSEYYSPTGNYTMQVWYYSDNTTKFIFDYSGEESSSEIGHAVRMTVSEGSTVKGTLYPVSMDEVMWVDSLPASLLATGEYTIAVYNPSDGLIVRCTLIVGSLSTITINNPDEGSISPPGGEYVVPTGSVLSRVGDNLVIKYGDSVLYTFVPTAPSEEMQLSAWWVNGTELTSDRPITSDLTISLTWETVSVTITFNANGGSGSMGPYSVPRNSSYTLPSNSFTPPSGKRFSYWDIDGTRYNVGSSIIADKNLTVKAMWYTPSPPGPTPPGPDPPGPDPPGPGPEPIDDGPDEIDVPKGKKIDITDIIEELKDIVDDLTWESSDPNVADIDENGIIIGKTEGVTTLTGKDSDGNVIITVDIRVGTSDEDVTSVYDTENGGQVILTYGPDSTGMMHLTNPITVIPGTTHQITEDQLDIVRDNIAKLVAEGINPHVVIPTDLQSLTIPSDLLQMIVENNGSLTIIEGDVTLYFSVDVLSEIGYDNDLDIIVIPVVISDGTLDIDVTDLPNAVIYEIYMLINGERVSRTFVNPINIVIDYQLEDGQTLDRLSLYYIDVEPFQKLEFNYDSEGIHFDVYHFSHYAISYDDTEPVPPEPSGCCWCWIVIPIIILLILFLIWFFLWKRFKLTLINEGGRIVSVPEGWKRESDSSISIRMRRKQEIMIPEIEAESPEGSHGMRIIGWDPVPPKRMTGSIELHLIWSNGPAERIGPSEEDRISDE